MPIELATRDFPWLRIEFPSSAQQQAAIHVEGKTLPKLFPDCRIIKQRFCGLTKSYIAVRL
jgi:hypothetical protein